MTHHVTAADRAATRFRAPHPAAARRFRPPALARMALGAAAAAAATMSMACAPASAQALSGAAFAGFVSPGFALARVDAPRPGGASDGATPTAAAAPPPGARAGGGSHGDRADSAGKAGTTGEDAGAVDGLPVASR